MSERRRLMGKTGKGTINYAKRYFTTTPVTNASFTVTIHNNVTVSELSYLSYSTDNGRTWTKTNNVTGTEVTITTRTMVAGSPVLWKGSGISMCHSGSSTSATTISCSGNFDVSGNIMSLLKADSFYNKTLSTGGEFQRLFYSSTVRDASNLILPSNVKSTTYRYTFYGCKQLTAAPELPATTLASGCYYYMFVGCTSLTSAPVLPATTLESNCYLYMFNGCSKLGYIKAMFTTTPSTSYTTGWVKNVKPTGTFVKNSAATWSVTGENGIPSGWTVTTASS